MTANKGCVLVTGASRGIGRATALALAQSGYDLTLWARSHDDLSQVADECNKLGVRATYAVVDVGDADAVQAAALRILAVNQYLTGVVLNAGHGVWTALADLTVADWRHCIDSNLNGTFYTLKACLPLFGLHEGALVVGILSDSALYPFANRSAYSAAKAGMRSLLDIARLELRAQGTRVSLLFPSRVDTYFSGSHSKTKPGTRIGALSSEEVASVIKMLFGLPSSIEIRELQLTATASVFGPFNEIHEGRK